MMAVMLVVSIGCVLGAPPNYVLVKHSGMDAHALRYVWVETVHLGTPWCCGVANHSVELRSAHPDHALADTSGFLPRCGY
jgi:hypothetical protein